MANSSPMECVVQPRGKTILIKKSPNALKPTTHSDRKSTRLNSSHEWISYAVFCLKKKNQRQGGRPRGDPLRTVGRGRSPDRGRPRPRVLGHVPDLGLRVELGLVRAVNQGTRGPMH